MAKLVTKKERRLLIDSRIIEDYPVLIDFLRKTPNLEDKELNTLGKGATLFFRNVYPKVIKEASKEWTVDKNSVEYFSGDTLSCELCSHRPINNICYIENNFTHKRLKIGTECAKHFGISSNINIQELIEEKRKIKKLEDLNSQFPGIEREINEWNAYIDEQIILIKKDVKEGYINLGVKAKQIFENYLNIKTSKEKCADLIKEMKQVIKYKEIEKEKIHNYINENKSNPLIPSRELINRLYVLGREQVISKLEDDGVIRHRTLFRINDEKFAESLISIYNKQFNEIDCYIDKLVTKKRLGYQFTYKRKPNIKLFCSYEDLTFNYYNFITGDDGDNMNFKGLMKISELSEENSIENALYELFGSVRGIGLSLEDIYHEFDEIFVYNKKSKLYYILPLRRIVNEFTFDLFINNRSYKDRFHKYIECLCKNPISKKDINFFRSSRGKLDEKGDIG